MKAPLYDLYTTGKLIEGVSSTAARDDLARLFKTSADKVARYVTREPALFKRGIDKAAAMKYKAALHQIGILVAFKSHQLATEGSATGNADGSNTETAEGSTTEAAKSSFIRAAEGSTTRTPERFSSAVGMTADNPGEVILSLAAAGSDILLPEEKSSFVAADIDTSTIRMVSVFAEPEQPAPVAAVSPDTSHMSIAAAGVDLLEEKPEPPSPLPLDLDSISLAPAGATLQQLNEDLPALPPNTDALAMAPTGADLLEGEQQPTPTSPAPDTSHLSVSLPTER